MPIDTDGTTENTNLSIDDGAEAILKRWEVTGEDASKPSEKTPEDEDTEEQETDEQSESDEDASEPSEDDEEETDEDQEDEEQDEDEGEPKPKKVLDDNTVVKVKVGEEELEVKVQDLKRLYGQEAALTKKSQAVSQKLKEAEDTGAAYVASLANLMGRAKQRAEPFAQIDWLVASKTLNEDELVALRTEAQKAYDDVNFFQQELDTFMTSVEQQRQQQLVTQAREAVEVLKRDIPNWSTQVYDEIRSFAIDNGMNAQIVNNLTDPAAIKMLHKAMLYDKGAKAVTKKTNKTPKKLVKSTVNVETTQRSIRSGSTNEAIGKLRKTGSIEDGADAFLARWRDD